MTTRKTRPPRLDAEQDCGNQAETVEPTADQPQGGLPGSVEGVELFWAAAEGSVSKVEAALEANLDPNLRDYESRTALHVASAAGNACVVKSLILRRAEVSLTDRWGHSPLDEARLGRHERAEAALRRAGASTQQERPLDAARRRWEIDREDVRLGDELGSTLKSVVHRATWNGLQVAAKFCLSDASDDVSPKQLEEELAREIEIMGNFRHPNLVMFLGCCVKDSPIMLVTELMGGGDLERYYCRRAADAGGRWTAGYARAARWCQEVLRALEYLHGRQPPIVHRDLKPMNVLLWQDMRSVKVADFGISKAIRKKTPKPDDIRAAASNPSMSGVMSLKGIGLSVSTAASTVADVIPSLPSSPSLVVPQTTTSTRSLMSRMSMDSYASATSSYKMTGGVGSWLYMAPEVARHETYTEKVDIYAWGLILYFLSSGYQPFRTYANPVDVLHEYSSGSEPRPSVADCPRSLRGVMADAWSPSPKHRPSARELQERMAEATTRSKGCRCPAQ